MDIEVLKKQIGKNILDSLDGVKEYRDKALILENGDRKADRKAVITLNVMDLYDIILKGDGVNGYCEIKENVHFDGLRDVLNSFFNFSLIQAVKNDDEERAREIERKAKDGETVRLV